MIVLAGVGVRPEWRAAAGVVPFAGDGADRGRRRDASPSAAPAAKGLASCRLFYARAGDISATGDVARMSCRPTHNGGCGCWWSRTMRPLPDGSPMWVRSAYAPTPAGTTTTTGATSNLQRRYWRVSRRIRPWRRPRRQARSYLRAPADRFPARLPGCRVGHIRDPVGACAFGELQLSGGSP
jgi:hypothetical protein